MNWLVSSLPNMRALYEEAPFYLVAIEDLEILKCNPEKFAYHTFSTITKICEKYQIPGAWTFEGISIPEFLLKIIVFKNKEGNFEVLRDDAGRIIQII